jgi:hypothetical protein
VIGRDTDMGRARFNHLQNRVEDADDRTVGPIFAFVESSKAIEVPEQLVRAVD